MGWYLRKALRVGPLRLNLSKSGLGVSAGLKGLRIGTGPRGAYVHAGRGGLYFRQRIGGPADRRGRRPAPETVPHTPTVSDAGTIHTAGTAQLVEESAQNLLREIGRTLRVTPLAPLVIGGGAIATIAAFLLLSQHWAWALAAIPCLAATIAAGIWARSRDVRLKTVHLWFDLSEDAGRRFKAFEGALQSVASCQKIWRVTTQQATGDWKRHAGATSLVTRHTVSFTRRLPPYFDSNVHPYALSLARQVLYFFPDQILVYEGNDVGAVAYDSLEIDVDHSEFRGTDGVPGDAKVIEHTWRYVNKKGGPDRRFTNNPQIPVCRYERIALRSPTGLNVHLMLSRLGVAQGLRDAEAELVPLKREAPDAEMPRDDAGQRKFEAWIRSQRRTQSAR